jgi:serine phosphatase RsbU (regulator of sigma subunit)
MPQTLNDAIIRQEVHCLLGLPILARNVCIGVAWVKYKRDRVEATAPKFMGMATGFAAEMGLVLESLQRGGLEKRTAVPLNCDGRHIAAEIASRREGSRTKVLESHVTSLPLGAVLGGDLCAMKEVDDRTIGALILDGEGHGVAGALNMLPFMTTFESCPVSYSAAHVISQLAATAKAVGARGTALCCIVSSFSGGKWLTVASAGHHSLLMFRRDLMDRWTFDFWPKTSGPMLGHPLTEPLLDERYEVKTGDVLVAYTDGVAEPGEPFSVNQVCQTVMRLLCDAGDKIDLKSVADEVLEESRKKQGHFRDDATLCVFRVA